MAGSSSRRVMLRRVLSGMAALPLSGALWAANRSELRLPTGAMRLTRILERGLGDGKAITVQRQWSIAFSPAGRSKEHGILVTGKQIATKVDAPERLAPLAKIEEARVTNGMFPLRLSETGLLAGQDNVSRGGGDNTAMAEAIAAAQELIASSIGKASETKQAMSHLAQMQQASQPLFAAMPRDLFFPNFAPIRDKRSVRLPDGTIGEFELTYNARAVPDAGWLASAERQIITRLGGDARQSREIWSLESMAV